MNLQDYVRIDEEKEETALINLVNPSTGKRIDLVGAFHIGRSQYYELVKEKTSICDIILYEWLAKDIRDSENNLTEFSDVRLQEIYGPVANAINKYFAKTYGLVGEFELTTQRDGISYDDLPSNWEWCDLNWEETRLELGDKKIKSMLDEFKKIITWIKEMPQEFDIEIEHNINTGIICAEEEALSEYDSFHRAREIRVYEEVEAIEQRDEINHIAIFYGVGHLSHMEREFVRKGYVRDGIEYLEAIRLKPKN